MRQNDAAACFGRGLGFDDVARCGSAGDFINRRVGRSLAQQLGFADLTARGRQGHLRLGGGQDLLGRRRGRRAFAAWTGRGSRAAALPYGRLVVGALRNLLLLLRLLSLLILRRGGRDGEGAEHKRRKGGGEAGLHGNTLGF